MGRRPALARSLFARLRIVRRCPRELSLLRARPFDVGKTSNGVRSIVRPSPRGTPRPGERVCSSACACPMAETPALPALGGADLPMSGRHEDSLYYRRARTPPQPQHTTNNVGLFLLALTVLAIIAAAALLGPDVLREFRTMTECWQNPELAVC